MAFQSESSIISSISASRLSIGEAVRFESEAAQLGRWYDVYAFRVGNPQLRHVGVLFKDVTEQKALAERLRRAAALDAFRVQLNDALTRLSDPIAIRNAAVRVLSSISEA
jgi:hypothetical protein